MRTGMAAVAAASVALFGAMLYLYAPYVSAMVLGIDFGSEFSKVALVKPGTPFEILHNVQSKRKTRSAVAFYKGERMFAGDADGMLTRKPQFVLVGGTELLGVNVSHPRAQRALERIVTVKALNDPERGAASLVLPKHRDTNPEEEETFSAEELVAQYLGHLKDFSETHADGRIRDVVMTIPSFYTQSERKALLRAADLADLKVLALADENTAAAVQFSIDRVFKNETRTVLFVNVGAGATEAQVVEFSSYKKLGKDASLGRVTAKAWDEALSSAELDNAMAELLADAFNEKHGKSLEGESKDIRDYLRPMQKIRKKAGKVVEILSANEEIPVTIESLTPSVDFRHHVSRGPFIARVQPILDRIDALMASVLAEGNYTVDDIDDVEVLGGGVRVPAVQERLRSVLATKEGGKRTLGVRLNGDEAMALGSAFMAANISTAFKVRHVGMVDGTPFGIGARVLEMPREQAVEDDGEDEAAAAAEKKEDEYAKKPWQRRASLYKKYAPLGKAKRISFQHDEDLVTTLYYDPAARLPEGTNRVIGRYNVTGVRDLVEGELSHLGTPKVTLHFKLNHNGIVRLSRAEAQWEEIYYPSPSPSPSPSADSGEEGTEDKKEDGEEKKDSEGKDDKAEGDKKSEEEDKEKKEDEKDSAEEDGKKQEGDDEKKADGEGEAKEEDGDAESTPTPTPEPKKRVVRRPLRVSEDLSALDVKPLQGKALELARARLLRLARADADRRERQRAKNTLEGLIYSTREQTIDRAEEFESVTSEEQREALSELLEAARDWLDDDGEDVGQTEAGEYDKRAGGIRAIADAAWSRHAEKQARPKALADAKESAEKLRGIVGGWQEEKPWITEVATEVASKAVSELSSWIEKKVAEQEGKEAHEEPAFTAKQLRAEVVAATRAVMRTHKTPKPTPTPAPESDAATNGTNSTAGEGEGEEQSESAEGKSADASTEEGSATEEEEAKEGAASASGGDDDEAAQAEGEDGKVGEEDESEAGDSSEGGKKADDEERSKGEDGEVDGDEPLSEEL